MKLGLVSDENGHNFTFTSPQATAVAERERFKSELTAIIGRNRSGVTTPAPQPPPPPITAAQAPSSVPSPRPPLPLARQSVSRAPSVASDSHGSTPVNDPTSDFRLRKKVLLSMPDLAALHRELVLGGQITENEFWEGREVSLLMCVPRV